MSKKMKNAPVFFTIIQVRFNSIQKMDEFAPSIQEKFRKSEFPDAQTSVLNMLNFNFGVPTENVQSQAPMKQLTQYTSSNFERTACFVLDHSSLTLQTTEHDTFETFFTTFLQGLKIVDDIVGGIAFIDRLGLRYLDAFKAKNDDAITEYVSSGVTGLFDSAEAQVSHSFSETVYKKSEISVTARVIILNGPFGFPMDVQPGSLKVGERFKEIDGVHAMLDIDCSVSSRERLEWSTLEERFNKIHGEVDDAFRKATTEYARRIWK